MLSLEKQRQFAELAVKIGVNMQPNQEVVIQSDVSCQEFARTVAEQAYKHGAKLVTMRWSDEKISRMSFDYATTETLCEIPEYSVKQVQHFIDKKVCLINIVSRDPDNLKGVPAEKVSAVTMATGKAMIEFRKATMSNYLRWCIISVPSVSWAKKVFPELNEQQAVDKLWDAIAMTMRLDSDNPTKAWQDHINILTSRAKKLTEYNFDYLHLTASNGTDLKVGLADNHLWIAAQEEGQDGVPFTANMPTEEVFTAPHKDKVNGIVHSARPLVYNGTIIDNFALTFKDGEIVDFTAEQGYQTLKELIETDNGSRRLGEIALLGKNSPISQSGIMFYNTLFDENASCHLALGASYPTNIKDGNSLTDKQRSKLGANESLTHVDFMVGTTDLNIDGVDKKGNVTVIFRDGEWCL